MLFEDSAALIGLLIAFAGTYLSVSLNLPVLAGVASILIGFVLAATATLLARKTKGLLIREPANQSIVDAIAPLAEAIEGIAHANGILTVHLAPQQIVGSWWHSAWNSLTSSRHPDIEAKVSELERRLCRLRSEVVGCSSSRKAPGGFNANNRRSLWIATTYRGKEMSAYGMPEAAIAAAGVVLTLNVVLLLERVPVPLPFAA
jgi:hypothetical protein